MRRISQRYARQLKKRLDESQAEMKLLKNSWASAIPADGVFAGQWTFKDTDAAALKMAARLGCALVLKHDSGAIFTAYAVKP